MALYKDEVVTLRKENVSDYFKREKPSSDIIMGYRDGTLDVLRLMRELATDESIQTVDQMHKAMSSLHENRLELIAAIDKIGDAHYKKTKVSQLKNDSL